MIKKIAIAAVMIFALCIPSYAQRGGSRSFSGGSSYRSSPSRSSSSFSSRSSPGSSLAKSRALTQSANQKSSYQNKSANASTNVYSTRSSSNTNTTYRKSVVVPQSNYQTRNVRITNVYKSYPPTYNNYHYNDSFHPFLTGMLIGRLMDNNHHTETVRYIHSNWDSFDEARKQQLLRENAGLKAELDALKGVPPDPNARLSGVDEDVTYHDNYVTTPYDYSWMWSVYNFLKWTFIIGVSVGLAVLTIWIVFIKKFKD